MAHSIENGAASTLCRHPNPTEFLQLYAIIIESVDGDNKVMANWFPMVLKDAARSWLMNLPEGSIFSWFELCAQFVSNFKGTFECSFTLNKIPQASDAAIISVFSTGARMREKLAVNDELDTVATLFDLADKCAKAEEGRLFHKSLTPSPTPPRPRGRTSNAMVPLCLRRSLSKSAGVTATKLPRSLSAPTTT